MMLCGNTCFEETQSSDKGRLFLGEVVTEDLFEELRSVHRASLEAQW